MARLSPSSNTSYPTADPRRQQNDNDADDNNNTNDDDDHHDSEHDPDHGISGQQISSPDYVHVEIPQSVGVAAPGQQSSASTSSEGYPSWLPKRPPPLATGSTLHSLSTEMMFGDSAGVHAEHPGGGGQPAPAKIVNSSRRPCLSQVGANPLHVPCASSACRTRMPPPLPLPVVVVGSVKGQIGRRRRG